MVNALDAEEMTNLMSHIKANENEFVKIICNRLGIIINEYQLSDMRKSILQTCHKFNCTPESYLTMLINCRDDSPLLEQLITSITVGETYFFRDSHQMQLLKEIVLPSLIKTKRETNNLNLRIWSAGCSSGEEIYTLAIMISEMIPDIQKWNLQLFGSDINTSSLQKAIEGTYGEWSMRSISSHHKEKYFSYENNKYYLDSEIKKLVNFTYLNLQADTYPSMLNNTNALDLILCRNVLIYFDSNHIEKLMKKLNACLIQGGFLLLGASDPINIKKTNFISYPHEAALLMHSLQSNLKKPKEPEFIYSETQPNSLHSNAKIEETNNIKTKLSSSIKLKENIQQNKNENNNANKIANNNANNNANLQLEITQLMDEARWQEALEVINHYSESKTYQTNLQSIFLFNSKATTLANLGQLDEAKKVCYKSLALDSVNTQTHFLLAMILVEQNLFAEAESALRKSIFFDHQFVAGHFQLGLLLIRKNLKKEGIKSLKNALSITLSQPAADSVQGFKGLDYGHLVEILKREIELYSH